MRLALYERLSGSDRVDGALDPDDRQALIAFLKTL